MKNLLLLFVMLNLFQQLAVGQTLITYNTYYIVPPTTDCDGVWAVGPYSSQGCNGGTYIFSPMACGTIASLSGDTLFISLCSIPCNFTATDPGNGNICLNCFVYNDFSTSTTETNSTLNFSLYPNPATTQLTVEFNTEHRTSNNECRIYNGLGQEIFPPFPRPSSSVPFQTTFDISSLSSGLYYLHLQTGQGTAVKKFEVIR